MTESSMTHDMWEELAAGHALHALTAEDEQRLLDHLKHCSRCAATLDEYRLVGAQLGALADSEADDPPSWRTIRSGIIVDEPSQVVDLDARRRNRATRLLAAAAVVVTISAIAVAGWDSSHRHTSPATSFSAALATCERQAGCSAIRLHTTDGDNTAAVIVEGNHVTVVPLTLAAAPSGRTYVLWQLPRDGGPIPVNEFRATDRDTAPAPLPSSYADTTAFAVSLESATATPTRPTDVLAIGAVDQRS